MKQIKLDGIDHNKSLMEHLQDAGVFLPAYCGGKGICGKCKVRFLKEAPAPRKEEAGFFSREELKAGWRLACLAYVSGRQAVELIDSGEESIEVATDFHKETGDAFLEMPAETKKESQSTASQAQRQPGEEKYALAIDLGTTTIAAALVDRESGEAVKTITSINHQRRFGADVITRIEAANGGKAKKLKEAVWNDLSCLCARLGLGDDIFGVSVPVIISGNSTMEHLLQGLSCENLGRAPFTPIDISMHRYRNLLILPGISTYVGADIVSGIVACGMDQKEEITILVDLGTNGEMAIGNKDKILVASTAAGPAFEGGNISCGVAGVPGAIDTVSIKNGQNILTTIGQEKPVGICGTGVIEAVYEMVKAGAADRTGLLDKKYLENGYPLAKNIFFTAKDVREVQMAKSAIRSGIEILLSAYGADDSQINRLYLAGGFGRKINCQKAVGIGMLPPKLESRIMAVGNSSLKGASMLAKDIPQQIWQNTAECSALPDSSCQETARRFLHVIDISEEITLSCHSMFQDLYMEHMFFGE